MEIETQEDVKITATPTLGDRMKAMEKTARVPPYQSFIVRADGNRFSKYTQGLKKPFDVVFLRAMTRAANGLLEHFKPMSVFVCSDEISLVFGPVCTEEEFQAMELSENKNIPGHIFSGRYNKIETLVSSKAAVLFNNCMVEELKNKVAEEPDRYTDRFIERVESRDAIFDARLIPIPLGAEFEIVNNLIWRSCYDCYRNTVAAYARHVLGKKLCNNKNGPQMIALMKENGFDFAADVSTAEKYGVFCKKIVRTFVNEKGEDYERYRVLNFCMNMNEQEDKSKCLQLLMNKYFEGELLGKYEEYTLQIANDRSIAEHS